MLHVYIQFLSSPLLSSPLYVYRCIIRRTSVLLTKYLPVKVEQVCTDPLLSLHKHLGKMLSVIVAEDPSQYAFTIYIYVILCV